MYNDHVSYRSIWKHHHELVAECTTNSCNRSQLRNEMTPPVRITIASCAGRDSDH